MTGVDTTVLRGLLAAARWSPRGVRMDVMRGHLHDEDGELVLGVLEHLPALLDAVDKVRALCDEAEALQRQQGETRMLKPSDVRAALDGDPDA